MEKIDLKQVKNLRPNPIFKGLPSRLKDVKVYNEIEGELKDLLKTEHTHKTATSYVKCDTCQKKYQARKKRIHELGFSNIQQYFEWKKVMEAIINKIKIKL